MSPLERRLRRDGARWRRRPPPLLRQRVMDAVAREPAPRRRPALLRPLPLLACAAVAALVLIVLGGLRQPPPPAPATVRAARVPAPAAAPGSGFPRVPTLGIATMFSGVNERVEALPTRVQAFADATMETEWNSLVADMRTIGDSMRASVPGGLYE